MGTTQSPRAAGGTLPPAEQAQPQLPPGFRFHPTDEELVVHYLKRKAQSAPLPVSIIAEIDLYKFDPWELPEKAVFGEQEWYFFSPRERKYPNGARPNRAATSGYWKATGTDKPVLSSGGNQKVGVKKALVFYGGKPPRGVKTNWIMHEYRLVDHNKPINKPPPYDHSNKNKASLKLDDWVLCRIYKKNNTNRPMDQERDESMDDVMMMGPMSSMSIPSCSMNNNIMGHHPSFSKANYNSFLNTHVDQQQQGLFDGMMVGHGMDSGAPPSLSHLSNPSSSSSLKRTFPSQYCWGGTDPNPNTGVSVGVGSGIGGGDGCDLPSPSKRMSLLHMTNDDDNNNTTNNNNSSEESGSRSHEQQETNNNNNNMNSFSSLLNQQPLHQQPMLGLNDGVFRHPYSLPGLNWYS